MIDYLVFCCPIVIYVTCTCLSIFGNDENKDFFSNAAFTSSLIWLANCWGGNRFFLFLIVFIILTLLNFLLFYKCIFKKCDNYCNSAKIRKISTYFDTLIVCISLAASTSISKMIIISVYLIWLIITYSIHRRSLSQKNSDNQ